MDGLHAAFLARVGQDAELKFTSQGTALVSVSVSVQDSKAEGQPQWIRIGKFSDDDAEAEELVRQLTRGSEVYCEGRLKLKTWQGADGNQRTGLDCHAWKLEVIGRIGRSAPARARRRNPDAMPQSAAIPRRSESAA